MNIRLNLAPEIYQSGQRAKQRRQVATQIGIAVSAVAGGLVVAGLVILGGQKVLLNNLNASVKQSQSRVASYSDLQVAATAQQHLQVWEQLAGQQGKFSQFFQILQEFAPQGVAASSVQVSNGNLLTMSGTAQSYTLVTKFAKALEESNVEVGTAHAASNQPYFSNVQLTGVSSSGQGTVGFQLTTQMSSEVTSGQ